MRFDLGALLDERIARRMASIRPTLGVARYLRCWLCCCMIPPDFGNTPQVNQAVVRTDWMSAPAIMFTALDPAQDAEALVA